MNPNLVGEAPADVDYRKKPVFPMRERSKRKIELVRCQP